MQRTRMTEERGGSKVPTLLARITNFWQLERKAEAVEQQDIAAAQAYSLEAEEARATERAAKQVATHVHHLFEC